MADQELEQQEPLLGRKDQINIQRGDQYTTQNSQEQKQAKVSIKLNFEIYIFGFINVNIFSNLE